MSGLDKLKRPGRDSAPRLTDYAAERVGYRVQVPERFNAVRSIVDGWAAAAPDAPPLLALDGAGEVVGLDTIADLASASRRAARALLAAGVTRGDHVFVMLPRIPEGYAALLGCMRIGAVPMPGPNLLTPKDIAYRCASAAAVAAVTDAAGAVKVDEAGIDLRVRLCVSDNEPDGWVRFAQALDEA